MAHASVTPGEMSSLAHDEHTHPGPGLYVKIGLALFVLTALEVGVYEVAFEHPGNALGTALRSVFVPVILLLSACKFALVAMYYMHLKQDGKLLSGVFIFGLILAALIIVGLMLLMAYHHAFARLH
ncbi:MAG TPA: cytochrome C oxidase subunit IV family protein [Gemmatimonadales bacterium]|nr:cytochrome C oxidase subunit IV family protein [Gemmatimonadales bacterium]